ncbi:MAG: DUF7482 domain-containing protein [Acidimicrobiales bacterium]
MRRHSTNAGRLAVGAGAGLLTAALLAACGTTAPPSKTAKAGNTGTTNVATSQTPATCVGDDNGHSGAGHFRFNTSACENGTTSVTVFTLPLHMGTGPNGQTVYYVITDTSDQALSDSLGVNFAPKLANAKGTKAVQVVTQDTNGTVHFPGTVSFGHARQLVAGPDGFPPTQFSPPSLADDTYSPLIQLPNGTVENAPQVANASGQAAKVVLIDKAHMKVEYRATMGFYENKEVHYASFDASDKLAATLEDVTYAPNLNAAPSPGDEDMATSAREELIAFTNGPTGDDNPLAQGLSFAVESKVPFQSPRNLLHETPTLAQHANVGSTLYSPLWDVHFATWTTDAIAAGDRIQLRDVDTVVNSEVNADPHIGPGGGVLTGLNGAPFGASGIVVDCPLVSIDIP